MRKGLRALLLLTAAGVAAGSGAAQWPFTEGPAGGAGGSLARDMVSAHNAVRAGVGTPPLTWSDSLAALAQNFANRLLASGGFAPSHNPDYGENLFDITGAAASSAEVVKAWAGEARDYDYSSNTCRARCGHYTQVVWSGTKQVGCGVARGGGREVWVCNYNPPGNWAGQRPY